MPLLANIFVELTAELSLFAAAGFLLFAIDDLMVDLRYFIHIGWQSLIAGPRFRDVTAISVPRPSRSGWMAIFIPAWNEANVIAQMLTRTLDRYDTAQFHLFVGHYRNDPATAAAIASVHDHRLVPVQVDADGPTTKADCLNRIYDELISFERAAGCTAKAIVLHDAEDLVDPAELRIFDWLIEQAGVVQLPVVPLLDPRSRWVAGHYADEFAEAHMKELVVREALGAAVPLAGVGCAIERSALARLADQHGGRPFDGHSMTEDYQMGLKLGAAGIRSMFVRIPQAPGSREVVASRGYFPATIAEAVRQKTRWVGGIAFAGWDQLGWRGGLGERWMRLRDRRGPLGAILIFGGYLAGLMWAQLWLAAALGAKVAMPLSPALSNLIAINGWLLAWRLAMRAGFTAAVHGWREGLRSLPRVIVANLIMVLAAWQALKLHSSGGPERWDKTDHIFPSELTTQ